MKSVFSILLTTIFLAAGAGAQEAARQPSWQLEPAQDRFESPLSSVFPDSLLGLDPASGIRQRPRLTVSLSSESAMSQGDTDQPGFSWSLEAWEMNTASLAHIQCSRATRTIEAFVVENCRFVDQPPPRDSANLIQVKGRWLAAPGLSVGAGAYSGRRPAPIAPGPIADSGLPALAGSAEAIEGLNMNVSFGLSMGHIGSLLIDLQLDRYRKSPDALESSLGVNPPLSGNEQTGFAGDRHYGNAGQLGLTWRGEQFGADLTGQYQELPYWLGERLEGEGFRSFDIEFSWRAPSSASISVGVSNVLDRLPATADSTEQGVEKAVDGIYGRIPYVRYKHDL